MTTTMLKKISTFRNSLYCTDVLDNFDLSGALIPAIDTMETMHTSDLENATRYDMMLLLFDGAIEKLQQYIEDMQKSRSLLAQVASQWEDDIIAEYGKEEWEKWTR